MKKILQDFKEGRIDLEEVLEKIKSLPYEDLDFAKIDNHRYLRKGFPETVYCQGKTTPQVLKIFKAMLKRNHNILATKANKKLFSAPIFLRMFVAKGNNSNKNTKKLIIITLLIKPKKPPNNLFSQPSITKLKVLVTNPATNRIIKFVRKNIRIKAIILITIRGNLGKYNDNNSDTKPK